MLALLLAAASVLAEVPATLLASPVPPSVRIPLSSAERPGPEFICASPIGKTLGEFERLAPEGLAERGKLWMRVRRLRRRL